MSSQPSPLAAAWDAFAAARGGHLLQTSRWGALKRAFGWRDEIVTVTEGGQIRAGALVLFRALPLRLGTIAYIPRGPVVDWDDPALVARLFTELDRAARKRHAVLLKIEPDIIDSPAARQKLLELGFRLSPQTVQPPRTILIDVSGTEEAILARMNQGTRRKIRIASRKGIVIRRGSAEDIEAFARLTKITGERNEFGVHSTDYYRKAAELFMPDRAALLIASYEERDLAGLMVFGLGDRAWYFYGASSNEERDRMPTYGLQWEAIRWARERGHSTYDLWGIPDENEDTLEAEFQGRHDGLWGVYGFKRGFGGEVARTVGAWDRVYRPLLYRAYSLIVARREEDQG